MYGARKTYEASVFIDSGTLDIDIRGRLRSDDPDSFTLEIFGPGHRANPTVRLTELGEIIFTQATPHATPPQPRDYGFTPIAYIQENKIGTPTTILEVTTEKRPSDQMALTTIITRQPVKSLTVRVGNYPLMPETTETLLTIAIGK